MEKVLLTGASGFIGQHMLPELMKSGYEIHKLLLPPSSSSSKKTTDNTYYADIKDYAEVNKLVKKISPDYVIHLAGASSVARSYNNYNSTMEVNYSATVNLAEACRGVENFKQFIFAGSSEEYGAALKNARQKITEATPLNPESPYALSKVNADMHLQYMGTVYGFPYTIIRSFNTYGRENSNSFFIEKTISNMLSKEQNINLGDPSLIRDWLYIDDHVSGYMQILGNQKAIRQVIQLSTGKGHSIKETAEIIAEMTGYKGNISWNAIPKRPFEASIMIGDNSKAKKLLGWEPKYDLRDGLEKTISFWRGKQP